MIALKFFYYSGVVMWASWLIFVTVFILMRRNARLYESDAVYIKAEKDRERREKAPLTLPRYMDALAEAAEMQFNEIEISMHDFNQIDELI